MDIDTRQTLGQIIDNQIMLNNKIDQLIQLIGNLTNTIIKYDTEYQNEIAQGAME